MKKKYVWTFSTRGWLSNKKLIDNLIYLSYSTELVKLIKNTDLIIFTDPLGENILKNINIRAEIISRPFLKKEELFKWAMPKLQTIASINEPFYHIDHDVFLFQEQEIKEVPITAQSLEAYMESPFYLKGIKKIREFYPDSLPKWCEKYEKESIIGGFNCGYLHFQSMNEKKMWTDLALNCYSKQTTEINCDHAHVYHNVISEQFTLFALNEYNNKSYVNTLFLQYNWRNLEFKNYVHLPSVIKYVKKYSETKKRVIFKIISDLNNMNKNLYKNIKIISKRSYNEYKKDYNL
jgi:hypothetical protein